MAMKSGTFFSIVLLSLFFSCKQRNTVEDTAGIFTVHNLGITFGSWDVQTGRAGDFVFLQSESKVFLVLGAVVADGQGGTKELPTFEYRIRKDARVFAIAEGRVTRLVYQQATQDWELSMRSQENPAFEVGYDHVKNPQVDVGDTVNPGDSLGNPGTWSANLGRFEIMINNTETGLSYCPFCFFDPNSSDVYQNKVLQLMSDWEVFKNDASLYDENNHVYPGCRMSSMVSY
jgi:hypothetical protein